MTKQSEVVLKNRPAADIERTEVGWMEELKWVKRKAPKFIERMMKPEEMG